MILFMRTQNLKLVKMWKKFIYRRENIPEESVIDFCERCGKEVWGERMFNTIVQNMGAAREKQDLCHSQVIEKEPENL